MSVNHGNPFADSGGWHLREGMKVYASDSEELGTVSKVWPENVNETMEESSPRDELGTEEETNVALTANDPGFGPSGTLNTGNFASAQGLGIPSEGDTRVTGGGGYIKVERGHILGIGGRDLFVPYSGIARVDSDIRLGTTLKDAEDQGWQNKPPWLD